MRIRCSIQEWGLDREKYDARGWPSGGRETEETSNLSCDRVPHRFALAVQRLYERQCSLADPYSVPARSNPCQLNSLLSMPSLLEIEARLKDLEAWRPSKSEGEVVQKMIDWLDQVCPVAAQRLCGVDLLPPQALGHIEPKSGLYSRSARSLQALCRRSARLPFSCKLSDDITLLSPHSISSSALSDVYKGSMSGKYVAIKVLRVHVDNRDQVAKVRTLLMSSRIPLITILHRRSIMRR